MSGAGERARVVLIAGASGAIGGATARRLASEGCDLALTYRSNEAAAAAVAAEVEDLGVGARTYEVSLAAYEEVAAAVKQVVDDLGRLDAVVYASGPYLPQRWITEFEPGIMEEILREDTVSCWNLVHASIPALRETKGCVVAVSTPAVRRHALKDLLSSAPKAAIEAIVRAVAAEEGKYGMRANAVGVGALGDGMYHKLVAEDDFDDKWLANVKKVISLQRLGTAVEIAEAIAFLASPDRAGYISGQTLAVDGGYAL